MTRHHLSFQKQLKVADSPALSKPKNEVHETGIENPCERYSYRNSKELNGRPLVNGFLRRADVWTGTDQICTCGDGPKQDVAKVLKGCRRVRYCFRFGNE